MISISGLISAAQKREILKYAKFCAKELGIKGEILITVSLYGNDYGIVSQLGQNKYEIWLNKALIGGRQQRQLRETLGHELKHVQQFESGRLEAKNGNLYFVGECMASVHYIQRPFEIEARAAGRELVAEWLKKS